MVLQPAFSDESCLSSASRSSSSSSMTRSFTVDSSPPSSPSPEDCTMDASDDEIASRSSMKDGKGRAGKNVSWRVAPIRRNEERDDGGSSSQHSPVHPYSASTLSTMMPVVHKSPTLYEKNGQRAMFKRHNPNLSVNEDDVKEFISRSQLKAFERGNQRRDEDNYLKDDLVRAPMGETMTLETTRDPDDVIWEDAIDEMVDLAGHSIDLSNKKLTKVSTKIADLEKLVVLEGGAGILGHGPLSRTNSAMPRTFSRSTTSSVFGSSTLGSQAREIHLFLMNNSISCLPNELFRLDTLVTLSLRANSLEILPPLISQLRNLRELNVANNKLKYLPREILGLKLTSLSVEMNPFLEPDGSTKYGPITRRYKIMPLMEQCLRVLFQPLEDTVILDPNRSRNDTVLEMLYDVPLDVSFFPPNVKTILSACVPGSVAVPSSTSVSYRPRPFSTPRSPTAHVHSHPPARFTSPCISTCPSRKHLIVDRASSIPYRAPVFVDHAEELFSWEKVVAGCKVGGEHGVPVLWRGCSAGCLEGLSDVPEATKSGTCSADDGNDGDWDMDVDAPVVQCVDDSDGEGLPEGNPAPQPSAGGQVAPFSSEDFEFDD